MLRQYPVSITVFHSPKVMVTGTHSQPTATLPILQGRKLRATCIVTAGAKWNQDFCAISVL